MKRINMSFQALPVLVKRLHTARKVTHLPMSPIIRFFIREGVEKHKKTGMKKLALAILQSESDSVQEQLKVKSGPYVLDFPDRGDEVYEEVVEE